MLTVLWDLCAVDGSTVDVCIVVKGIDVCGHRWGDGGGEGERERERERTE